MMLRAKSNESKTLIFDAPKSTSKLTPLSLICIHYLSIYIKSVLLDPSLTWRRLSLPIHAAN